MKKKYLSIAFCSVLCYNFSVGKIYQTGELDFQYMIYIKNTVTDPHFNLAAEEYILKNFNDDVIMLWQNESTVVLGKNQNVYAEINLEYVREHSIKVSRRLTGGGCVFHDLGNVNFSFISNIPNISDVAETTENIETIESNGSLAGSRRNILNFEYFTLPVIGALKNLGVSAEFKGRNDLLIDGMKFSGNAQCVYKTKDALTGNTKEKILHHGTILYNADISHLAGSLNVDEEKIKSKGVKSVKSRVTNVYSHLPEDKKMRTDEFLRYLEGYIINQNSCETVSFSEQEIKDIQYLADNKYRTDEFLYGSPIKYTFKNKIYYDFGTVEIYLDAEQSKIKKLKFFGDFFGKLNISELEEYLENTPHNLTALNEKLSQIDIDLFIHGADCEKILKLFM